MARQPLSDTLLLRIVWTEEVRTAGQAPCLTLCSGVRKHKVGRGPSGGRFEQGWVLWLSGPRFCAVDMHRRQRVSQCMANW